MKEVDDSVRRHHPKEKLDPPLFALESQGGRSAVDFSQIETCWRLSLVKGSRVHPSHRVRSRSPATTPVFQGKAS